jgi:periplasmic protein TonB
MKSGKENVTLDDIVFASRERSYGSYYLRKRYSKYLFLSFSFALFLVLLICLSSLYESYRRLHEMQQMQPYVLFASEKNAINELSQNIAPPPPPPLKEHEDEASVKIVEEEPPVIHKKEEKDDLDTTEIKDSLLLQQRIESTEYGDGNPYSMGEVEEMPQFPGGLAGLQVYISRNTRYPEEAMRKRISGTVVVRFCIEVDGTVTKIALSKAINPVLDSVSVQAIRRMPRWRPGRQHGKSVKVWYTIPINFVPMKS